DAAIAMRADVLEAPVRPLLAAAAPGAELHRVHRSAGAAPATPLELEPLRGLQGLGARILVADVVTAPGTEGVAVRHHPTAVAAFRPRSALAVAPLQAAAAVGAKIPEALHFRGAGRAALLGFGDLAPAPIRGHAPPPRPRCAG